MIKISKDDYLQVVVDVPLSTFNQNFFTKFYQPILSPLAYNLYLTLYSIVKVGVLESDIIKMSKIKTLLHSTFDDILSSRIELEGLGLISTYINEGEENSYIIIIKNLPTPYAFFSNDVLNTMLKNALDDESYGDLVKEYIVHSFNLSTFKDITQSIDEAFVTKSEMQNWWIDNQSNINVKKNHIDYEYMKIILSSSTNLNPELIKSVEFYENINRMAFMFELKDDEMIEAIKLSIIDDELNYDDLRKTIVKLKTNKKIELVKRPIETKSSSKLINTLNNSTPSKIVQSKYHTSLTPSEVEMFDKLLASTGISLGVLNACIINVMEKKNKEIPSYNYFLKVINTWIRKGITTTEAALKEISTPSFVGKKSKPNTVWYDSYQKELAQKKEKDKTNSETGEESSLEELEEFFNNKEVK